MSEAGIAIPSFDELYERIRSLPEGVTGEILEAGALRTMSRPGRIHRRVAGRCERALDRFNEGLEGTGWWIEVEAEIRLPPGRLVVPDLAGWRVERVPDLPDENPITVLPDWCCEILSPSTARVDRGTKLPMFARAGIAWVWLVDPELRLVEVFETLGGRPSLVETAQEGDTKALPPFDGALAVETWWET